MQISGRYQGELTLSKLPALRQTATLTFSVTPREGMSENHPYFSGKWRVEIYISPGFTWLGPENVRIETVENSETVKEIIIIENITLEPQKGFTMGGSIKAVQTGVGWRIAAQIRRPDL
jgi:hypothetical protein